MSTNNKIISLIVSLLLLLAIALGLYQRENSPELSLQNTPKVATLAQSITTHTETATFVAGGDISLSRAIAATIDKTSDVYTPFKSLEQLLLSTDFNFANLETPFSNSDTYTAKDTLVFNAPKKNIAGLVKYNFKIVNLANNHALDQGFKGVEVTKTWLTQNNIQSVGIGANLDDAWKTEIVEANDIRIGFVGASYASINDGGRAKNDYVARIEDTARLQAAITELKNNKADFIVATMHAGEEYTSGPNKLQVAFAHAAIDAGADIVIGAHPHWVQTIEKYNNKYIFYSLGNFIFDQNWSQETKEGLLLKIVTKKEGLIRKQSSLDTIELLPIIIENNSTPRLANETESEKILKNIGWTAGNTIHP